MEVVQARLRGRVASSIQSGYAVGNALSVALLPVLFGWFSQDVAWRCFFAVGVLPAILVFFVRRFVPESALFVEQARTSSAQDQRPFWTIFTGAHLFRTVIGTLFTTGTLGAAYVLITWLPTYLVTVQHLEVGRTAGYLALNIFGSFCGPIAFGYLADRLGRRKSFMLFLVLQAANVLVYTQGAIGAETTFALGFFLGAFQGGTCFRLMPTFSELFRPRSAPTAPASRSAPAAPGLGRAGHDRNPGGALPLGDAMVVCALSAYAVAFAMALISRRSPASICAMSTTKSWRRNSPTDEPRARRPIQDKQQKRGSPQ